MTAFRFIAPLRSVATGLALALSACQSLPETALPGGVEPACSSQIAIFRQQVASQGVSNAASVPLADFPLLHSNRFLSALAATAETPAQQSELVTLLARQGSQARAAENSNLEQPWTDAQLQELMVCASALAHEPDYRALRRSLVNSLRSSPLPRDHYSTTREWLGVLPLLRPIFRWRIEALHRDERRWFEEPESFARTGDYSLEAAPSTLNASEIEAWFSRTYESNSLRLPLVTDAQLAQLFRRHAPDLHIDYGDSNDALGAPVWAGDELHIDTSRSPVYTLPSFTRFAGENLLQLNYVFWFPARNPVRPLDLYAGRVDGIIWRVTLDRAGRPLLYDSIHSCGCYHKYFRASPRLGSKSRPSSGEPANIFDLTGLDHGRALRLTITRNEHFIVGVDNLPPDTATPYQLSSYQDLYRLPAPQGNRSMFDAEGIVPGSKRLERFTLWSSGIANVGAMRQWGSHATGFVAHQHFDDADLFDRYFEMRP